MRWMDEITLIAVEEPEERINANGFPNEPEETRTVLFGNKKSVGYSEFYKAAVAGYAAELKVDVYTEEYGGQKLAEVEGVRYRILRTYRDPKNTDITELTLSDLPEAQEDQDEEPDSGEQEGGGDGGTV